MIKTIIILSLLMGAIIGGSLSLAEHCLEFAQISNLC